MIEKPPLGLRPRWVWIELRIDEINEAIERFRSHPKDIPHEWINELRWLESEHPRALKECRARRKNLFTESDEHRITDRNTDNLGGNTVNETKAERAERIELAEIAEIDKKEAEAFVACFERYLTTCNPSDEELTVVLSSIYRQLEAERGPERFGVLIKAILVEVESDLERARRDLADDPVLLATASSVLEPLAENLAEILNEFRLDQHNAGPEVGNEPIEGSVKHDG